MAWLHPGQAAAQSAAEIEPGGGPGSQNEGIATMRHGVQAHA
jgi:hypothetical protein